MLALLALLALIGTGAALAAATSSGQKGPEAGGVRTAPNGVLAADPALAAALVESAEGYAALPMVGDVATIGIVPRSEQIPASAGSAREWMHAQALAGMVVLMSMDGRNPGQAIAVTPGREVSYSHVSRGGPFAVVISPEGPAAPAAPPGQPFPPAPPIPGGPVPTPPAGPVAPPPGPVAPPPPPAPPVDPFAALPPELGAKAEQVVATGSPPALAALGQRLAAAGFPAAAAAAAKLATEREAFYDLSGGVLTVRPGDIASRWAQHYTGSFGRWPELCAPDVNPGMRVEGSGNAAHPAPWKVGQRVYLPRSWEWHRGQPAAPVEAVASKAPEAKRLPGESSNAARRGKGQGNGSQVKPGVPGMGGGKAVS